MLKNKQSSGLDNINKELLKYGGNELLDQMNTLFNKKIDQKEAPEKWKVSITIPVFKKGNI